MKKILLILVMMVSVSFAAWTPYSAVTTGQTIFYLNHYCLIGSPTISGPSYVSYANKPTSCGNWFISDSYQVQDVQCTDTGSSYKIMTYTYPMTFVNNCPIGQTLNDSGFCVAPTCTPNEQLNTTTNKCECKGGYDRDYSGSDDNNLQPLGTCSPKKNCPPQMQYFWTNKATDLLGFQTEYAGCIPRTDLSEVDCASQGGTFYKWANDTSDGTSQQAKYMLSNGEGCVNEQYLASNAFWDNFSLLMSGFIIGGIKPFPASLANKAVTPEMLALEYKQAGNGANLLTHEPEIIDLVMAADGVYAEIGLNAKNASLDTPTLQTFNQWLKDNGLYGKTNSGYEYPTNDLGINGSVSSAMNNMYKGGDEIKFSDNILGASKVADKADSFASMDASLNIGATKTSTIDLQSLLNDATTTKSYPVTSTVLEKTTSATGEVTTKTLSKINYPDGTYSNVTTLAQKFADATTKYDITISTPIATTNGTKTIEQAYAVTKDSSGATTNSIVTKEPTISYTDSSGHTATASNTSVDTATENKDLTTPLDLTNIQTALNQMNKTLTETKTLVQDLVNHIPANKVALDTALNNFKNGLTDFSLSFDNAMNFVNGLRDTLNNLQTQLDDALSKFQDKPTLSLPSGQCPFQTSWYGQTVDVDPCMFVAPYRPILVIFFTFFMSVGVLLFALKYLFNVSFGGK